MGFALSSAAGASSDALQKLLTRKFLEQIQTQRLNEDARQADMRNATDLKQLEATEGLRRDTLAATQQYREQMDKDRDAARELQAEQKFQGRLKLLPTGSRISGQQAVDFAKYGASPLLKPAMTTTGEPEFEYKGTQDASEAATRAAEAERNHDLLNAAAEERLRLSTAVAEGRMSNAAANLELARIRTELAAAQAAKPGALQYANGPDGTLRAFRTRADNTIEEVALPEGVVSRGTPTKTIEQIRAEAEARAAGTAAGKGGGGLFDILGDLFTSTPAAPVAPTAPAARPTTPAARPTARPAPPQEFDWVNGKLVPRKAK